MKGEIEFSRDIDDRRGVRILHSEELKYSDTHFFTMHNGRQWSGAPLRDIEMVRASIEVLQEYLDYLENLESEKELDPSEDD